MTDCETLAALLPAYSVGATDPEETALVERLLPLCPDVAAELGEYDALVQALHYTAPAAQPPAALHDRLMAAVQAEATAPAPVTPPAPVAPPVAPVDVRPRVVSFNRALAGAVGIAAALLIVSNIYWSNQVSALRRQQEDTVALLRTQQDALASLGTQRANRVELVSTDSSSASTVLATVLWSEATPTALLFTDELPRLSPDRAYQLWVIQGEQPIGVGVFQVDEEGVAVFVFNSDTPMTAFNAVAITEEPAGGSDQPTTAPLAVAQL